MALGLDFLTQIINVQWGADAVFAFGAEVADNDNVFGRRYRGMESADKHSWILISENQTAFRSQSYALVNGEPTNIAKEDRPKYIVEVGGAPTFLLGSAWVDAVQIHQSHDAEKWSVAMNMGRVDGSFGVAGIVWEPASRAFYAGGSAITNPVAEERFHGRIWKSSEGTNWAQIAEFPGGDEAADAAALEAFLKAFKAHCTKPENRGGVPDGLQGYDPAKEIFMKPQTLDGWGIDGPTFGASGAGGAIKIEGGDNAGIKTVSVDRLTGVSFAGGIWSVVGNTGTGLSLLNLAFTSSDDGKTWTEAFKGKGYISAGMTGGAKSDIDRWKGEA